MDYLTRKEELILLAVHRLKADASLVRIREHLNNHTSKRWSVGNVYVPLDRMCVIGYLRCDIGEPTARRGGKAVKYYRLTEEGLAALADVRKVQDEMWDGFDNCVYE